MLAVGLSPPTLYHNVSASTSLLPPPVAVFNSVPRLVRLTYQPPSGRRRLPVTPRPTASMDLTDVGDSFHVVDDDVIDFFDDHGKHRTASGKKSSRKRGRRTVNLYPSERPKEARLYSRSSRGFLRVDPETWTVSTDRHGNSLYEVIEVMFLCQAVAALLGKCPPMYGRGPYDAGANVTSTADGRSWTNAAVSDSWTSTSSVSSGGSLTLLRFSAVDRYLCINSRAQVVLKERLDSIEECVFQHDTIGGQYDVYYSWKYPTSLPKTLSSTPCDPGSDANGCHLHAQRHRRRRWYLGVAKNGTLRTFISGSGHDAAIAVVAPPRHRTMFVQRWISRVGSAPGQFGPLSTRTQPVNPTVSNAAESHGGGSGGSSDKSSSSKAATGRRCSRLLRHCRRQRQQLPHRTRNEQPRQQTQQPLQQQQQHPQPHRLMRHGKDDGDHKRQRPQLGLSGGERRVKSGRPDT